MRKRNKILKSILSSGLSVITCGILGTSVFADEITPIQFDIEPQILSTATTILGWLAIGSIILSACIIVALNIAKKLTSTTNKGGKND